MSKFKRSKYATAQRAGYRPAREATRRAASGDTAPHIATNIEKTVRLEDRGRLEMGLSDHFADLTVEAAEAGG